METTAVNVGLNMGLNMGLVRGIATVFALLAFVAVVLWAYSKRPREAFRAAELLPLEEDDGPETRR